MPITIGLVFAACWLITFFILMALNWVGGDDIENNNYCERRHFGRIKQPVNTWSNLAFVISGLGMLLWITVKNPDAQNPMLFASAYAVIYGCSVIFLGPGSMLFHASQKQWGGWIDNISMNVFISFWLVYEIDRMTGMGIGGFIAVYLILNIIAALLVHPKIIPWDPMGILVFGILIGGTVVMEFVLGLAIHLPRNYWLLIPVIVTFGAALGIWFPSKTNGPACKPDSFWQGHSLWHLLCALATVFIFIYLGSEH
jgi:hypothetical protein